MPRMIVILVNSEGWSEKPPRMQDPGVRAVDGGAQRGEDRRTSSTESAVEDRHRAAQGAVAEPDRADHQREADAGVQRVPEEEVVRVALVELGAVAGRGPDQQRADEGQRERRPAASASPAAGRTRVAGGRAWPRCRALGRVPRRRRSRAISHASPGRAGGAPGERLRAVVAGRLGGSYGLIFGRLDRDRPA